MDWTANAVEEQLFDGNYQDTNEDGVSFPSGAKYVYPSSVVVKPLHLAPPWGYGCTVFKLGTCDATLSRLVQEPSVFADAVSAALARPMFEGRVCRGFRVQIGVEQRDDIPLRAADETPALAVAVWAHDASSEPMIITHGMTMGEMASHPSLAAAAHTGTRMRMQVARAILDELGFAIPRGLGTKDPATVAYHLDVPLFSMVHRPPLGNDRGANVTCYLDAAPLHVGATGAAVYYSAVAGACFYPPPEGTLAPRAGRGSKSLTTTVAGTTGYLRNDTPAAPAPRSATEVIVLPFLENGRARRYLSKDTDERERQHPKGDNGALATTGGIKMRLRVIATVLGSPMSTRNGKLYGRIAIDTIESTLLHTDPLVPTVCFANTPEWVTLLTAAAKGGRVWELLNEDTAKTNADGIVTHYEIERTSLI
jgi:hypothetical protein